MHRPTPRESLRKIDTELPPIERIVRDFNDLPLKLQLAMKLGLPEATYAREHMGNSTTDETDSRYTRELATLALDAVHKGKIRGQLALRFAENEEMLLRTALPLTKGYKILNHGSPYDVKALEPRQATWQDSRQRRYRDGDKAICASEKTHTPVIRAMLHDARLALQGIGLVLSKKQDKSGRSHWFTSEEAIEAVRPFDGFIYSLQAEPPKWQRAEARSYEYFADRDEYRIYGRRAPLLQVRVGVEDLPPDLCVITGSDGHILQSLPQFASPREWSDETGISLRAFGDMWPLEDFPGK